VAISFVNNALGATNSTTSFSITLPATQANDIILLEYTHRGTGDATLGGTYSGGAFTEKRDELYAGSAFSGKLLWSRATGNHNGETVTGSGLTNSCAAIITIYRGAETSGDPIEAIGGENNGSGNETMAQITSLTNGAWIVLTVANSPDVNVTSQTCTSPGALTIRAERLSTGGTDTSVCHASAEKATAGATGALTWAQTDGQSASWAYAIKPAAAATHQGSGSPSLPLLTASGTGKKVRKGEGAPSLPLLTASGTGKKVRKGTGSPSLPLLTADGTGDVTTGPPTHPGTGSPSLPLITASGSGKLTRKGVGAPTLPLLTASGTGKKVRKGTGAATLPILTASGTGKKTRKGSGAPNLPILTASGTGKRTLRGSGAPTLPLLTAAGTGRGPIKGSGSPNLPLLTASGVGQIIAPSVPSTIKRLWPKTFNKTFA
jgi:hypothetical protein